jgi:hypothetical protein
LTRWSRREAARLSVLAALFKGLKGGGAPLKRRHQVFFDFDQTHCSQIFSPSPERIQMPRPIETTSLMA